MNGEEIKAKTVIHAKPRRLFDDHDAGEAVVGVNNRFICVDLPVN